MPKSCAFNLGGGGGDTYYASQKSCTVKFCPNTTLIIVNSCVPLPLACSHIVAHERVCISM